MAGEAGGLIGQQFDRTPNCQTFNQSFEMTDIPCYECFGSRSICRAGDQEIVNPRSDVTGPSEIPNRSKALCGGQANHTSYGGHALERGPG